jgi:ketohexokinase
MAQILLVGTATLDIVFTLERYPSEDDEVRAQGLRVCRGGNAANTAAVLAQLGHNCSFAGILADVPESTVITQDFFRHGVDFSSCVRLPGRPPTSSIQSTASSRTIVHFRDLPEMHAQQFALIELAPFEWIHFEGRNVPELKKMLARVRELRPQVPVSLELEKPREGIESVLDTPDLLICSRAYAEHRGEANPQEFLSRLRGQAPRSDLVVAWGDAGAHALSRNGIACFSPSFPPVQVVDALGAGDTFNAGLIDALVGGKSLQQALEAGCELAGKKCGIHGISLDLKSTVGSVSRTNYKSH